MQVFVCGMHRSGTSMVARLLNLLGMYFGPEGSGLPANRENPKGFWERRDIVELNDGLLAATESIWFDIYGFVTRGAGWRPPQDLRDALQAKVLDIDAHRPWFVKDPRLCLTLPYWLEHCERAAVVICSRGPEAVIASLARRTEITGLDLSVDEASALWEAYNVELLHRSRDVPRVFVRYEDVLESPLNACVKLADELASIGVRGLQTPDIAAAQAFVDVGLQRSGARGGELALPPRLASVDTLLRGASRSAPALSSDALRVLGNLHSRLAQTQQLRRLLAALNLKRGELEAVLAKFASSDESPWTVDRLKSLARRISEH